MNFLWSDPKFQNLVLPRILNTVELCQNRISPRRVVSILWRTRLDLVIPVDSVLLTMSAGANTVHSKSRRLIITTMTENLATVTTDSHMSKSPAQRTKWRKNYTRNYQDSLDRRMYEPVCTDSRHDLLDLFVIILYFLIWLIVTYILAMLIKWRTLSITITLVKGSLTDIVYALVRALFS